MCVYITGFPEKPLCIEILVEIVGGSGYFFFRTSYIIIYIMTVE